MKTSYSLLILCILLQLNGSAQKVVWKFKTDGPVYSSPSINNDYLIIGSSDGCLYNLNATTGKQVWKFNTGGAINSKPAIGRQQVFASSADGSLYAVNIRNGQLDWKFESAGEQKKDLWDYYLSSPILQDETLYWGCGAGMFYAIDSRTGKKKWEFPTEGIVHATPVVTDSSIYFGSFDGYFYALDHMGQLKWKFKTIGDRYFPKGGIQRAALLYNGSIFFGSRDFNLYALNAETGTGLWNYKEPGSWVIAEPLFYEEKIYFGTSDSHAFYCMDANSGTIIWKKELNMRVYGKALAHNGLIYFGCFNGQLFGVDPKTGNTCFLFSTPASQFNYSKVFNQEGKFCEDYKDLYRKDYKRAEASLLSLGSILSDPIVHRDVIYFGSTDGYIYAVEINQLP